jgi:hypothetical protein
MVINRLLLCKLKNLQSYLDGARMLVDSYLNFIYLSVVNGLMSN